jgi:hypothetical protein
MVSVLSAPPACLERAIPVRPAASPSLLEQQTKRAPNRCDAMGQGRPPFPTSMDPQRPVRASLGGN